VTQRRFLIDMGTERETGRQLNDAATHHTSNWPLLITEPKSDTQHVFIQNICVLISASFLRVLGGHS